MADTALLYRRQFLLTPSECEALAAWPTVSLGPYRLYAHPDVELTRSESDAGRRQARLVGFAIDPHHPQRSNAEILDSLLAAPCSPGEIAKRLHSLSGRFVLILHTGEDAFVFHDPCGLRSVCYAEHEGRVHVGSQPLLLGEVLPLQEGERFRSYFNSEYVKNNTEHWIPGGCCLFENVGRLLPNHFLHLSTLRQERYWPVRRIPERPAEQVAPEAADLLRRLLQAAHQRFELALPLTAGRDSRMLLSACRGIAGDVYFYTLQYRDLTPASADIRIPRELLGSLGYTHHLIDCRVDIDPDFARVYEKNTPLAHTRDWGEIAQGLMRSYPASRVCLKGNCAEIARCAYYKTGKHPPVKSSQSLVRLVRGWGELGFVKDHVANWFSQASPIANDAGVDILDLFYWEHRMGSWQAQSQLEWDIVQEAYSPFNHRELLETLLGVHPRHRRAPTYRLHRRMYEALWPEVLNQSVNPAESAKSRVKRVLVHLGLRGLATRIRRALPR